MTRCGITVIAGTARRRARDSSLCNPERLRGDDCPSFSLHCVAATARCAIHGLTGLCGILPSALFHHCCTRRHQVGRKLSPPDDYLAVTDAPHRLYCRITALSGVLQNEVKQQDVASALLSHGWRIDAVPSPPRHNHLKAVPSKLAAGDSSYRAATPTVN